MLLIEADDHLRFDGSVAQPSNDRLLNFRQGSRGGRYFAGVRNVDAALLIDSLGRQINEVTRTGASRLARRKQAARGGFKDRHIQNVADTDYLGRFGAFVGKLAFKRNQVWLGQEPNCVSGDVNKGIWQSRRGSYPSGRIGVYGVARGPGSRKDRA